MYFDLLVRPRVHCSNLLVRTAPRLPPETGTGLRPVSNAPNDSYSRLACGAAGIVSPGGTGDRAVTRAVLHSLVVRSGQTVFHHDEPRRVRRRGGLGFGDSFRGAEPLAFTCTMFAVSSVFVCFLFSNTYHSLRPHKFGLVRNGRQFAITNNLNGSFAICSIYHGRHIRCNLPWKLHSRAPIKIGNPCIMHEHPASNVD